jgi:hypothetical protein
MAKKALLHLEQLPGDQMNVKANNLPDIAKMIWNVCLHRDDIATAFITGMVGYCREKNISWKKMEEVFKTHNMNRLQ